MQTGPAEGLVACTLDQLLDVGCMTAGLNFVARGHRLPFIMTSIDQYFGLPRASMPTACVLAHATCLALVN
jgi:hypothetical protein